MSAVRDAYPVSACFRPGSVRVAARKTQRAHIHGIADLRDLPVRHTTRRTGRPFTLLLEKTAAVFEREATDRRSWQNDLQWLKGTTADF